MSGRLYIAYVLYRSAELYLIDMANVSTGPTLYIHYLIQLDGLTALDKLYECLYSIDRMSGFGEEKKVMHQSVQWSMQYLLDDAAGLAGH